MIHCSDVTESAHIRIAVHTNNEVEIFCSGRIGVGCNVTHPCFPTELLARLPRLGGLHKASFLSVHHCLPFTEVLTQLALQQSNVLQLNDLEFIPLLTAHHFGQNLSGLQTVTALELLAHPQLRILNVAQQLNADLFSAFYSLASLKIDLRFTQLPQDLFTPVAATLSDLMLYGRLSDFPRKSFGSLSRMSALTMSGHQLADRLREGDFEALGLLELLTLSRCGITVLPARIFALLPSLKWVLLFANQLRVLPTGLFAAQISLQMLDLSRNQLEALPLGLFHPSTKLVNLNLSRNRLLLLSAEILPPLHGLETLRLDGNRLVTIASGCFAEAQHLKTLLLDHNGLNWTSTEACDVLNGLRSLRLLSLKNNSLSQLCDQLSAPNHTTNSLRVLDVRHNRLTRLSAQLLHTLNSSMSGSNLYLSHNPWVCDCGAQLLHAFVKSNRMRFSDMLDVRCENSQLAPLIELSYRDFCLPHLGKNKLAVLAFICLSALSLPIIYLTVVFYNKYKLYLQIWLYENSGVLESKFFIWLKLACPFLILNLVSTLEFCVCFDGYIKKSMIYCSDVTEPAHIRIAVHTNNEVEIFCSGRIGVGCNFTHPCFPTELLARLPRLFSLHKASFLSVHHCLPFTEMLTQLALQEIGVLQLNGLEFITFLQKRHFGNNFSHFQNVRQLELFAENMQHSLDEESLTLLAQMPQNILHGKQQLEYDLLCPFAHLEVLTIGMDFVQLPAEIFAPVAQTLSELHLLGRLRAIPANTFGVFRNLTELALLGHQFEWRLRANDFTALDTLQVLKLQTCSITLLPAHIFFPLVALTWLNLETNRLRLLPDTLLAQQRQLRRLDLNDNQLEALPAALFESSTKLQKLFLTNNRLRSLSADILPPHNALVELYVDVNELHTITPGTFRQARHLRRLILSHNKLDWTRAEACAMFDGLHSLDELALQNNSLRFLCNQLGASNQSTSFLSFLDVRQNKLTHLSAPLLRALNDSKTLLDVYMTNNPWACDCSAQPLHAFVRSNRVRFPDVKYISCYEAQRTPLIELSYRDLCPLDLGVNAQLVRIFIYFSTLSLVVITGALCYYKYKLQLKIWLYAHSLCLRCISEAELDCDRKYDAFISYTHQDKHFVEHELVPGLEQGTPAFKVCIHVRDWLAGAFISEQIIDSVEQSRRTIIVLSQHFIQSEWALMEFRMAHQCALNEGRSRIILVIYGDSVDMELLDQELRAYLKMNTYLKWGEPWFWEKLRYAMPHSRLSWEREECANIRANEIPLQTMMTQALANISGDQSFITDVCAEIASNGTCSCAYNTSGVFVDCGSAHGHIQIQILVLEHIFVDIFCKPAINTKSLITTEQLANLPLLGGMHKIDSLSVHRCLPFTEMLAQLALQQCTILQLNDLEFVPLLTARHLGQNLSYLQTVTVLELLAHPQFRALHAAQQLDADLFLPFYSLVSLRIDLHFTQLPQGLFTPVAATLSDLMLDGRLSDFPRKSFGQLSRISELTMSGHQLADRLREGDFESLGLLEQLTLSSCGITVLPARIFAPLPSLKRLQLRANQLRVLPTGLFGAQINLQTLELSRNQLEALPLGLFHPSTKLVNLNLSRNRLLQLSAEILPPLHGLETLRLDGNRLRTIASGCFAEAQHLEVLLLDHNRLNWTSAEACDVLTGLRSLRLLSLKSNLLSHLCDQLSALNHTTNSLSVLDVRHNRLTRLSAQLLHTLNSSMSGNKLYLSHNPWVCDCGALLLHAFVKSNRMRFPDMLDVRCENSQLAPLVELSYHDFCLPDLGVRTSVVLAFIWLSAFSLSVITTALFYYKYKLQLQIWLYAHRWCLCCISEAELDRDRKYDAFISYTHQDEHFVEHELVPGLEQGTPAFKVCIHVRDWLAGAFISEQIIDSVEQSRRTIIVLSQHFIQSEWALMEFRMAHQCALNEGRSRIILVIYGDSVDMELLDQELRAYLKMNTYLKWGEPWFWEKLRYAMPHSQRGWQGEGRTKRRTDEISLQPTGLRA
ncbi:LOW QUALITY PROTEIN: uncharacterized protein LOC129238398 [Anastrepha obliqua]|uniref:LOW QUALITY PROTEIN: uncharacterized protein LOC129238398 n=1 Tax=Anastrepha obliqua TaxID=95512 RepID=UPI002409F70B|nr:LOW QUALITY PROTEIN: uncharacterized protein LOC129238398 [Anastrepha obliqua]